MWTSALLSNLHEGRIYWQQLQGTVIVQKRSLFLQCKSTPVVANCKHLTVHLSVFFLRSPYYLLSFLSRSGLQITLKQAITKHPFSDLLTSFRIEFSHCSSPWSFSHPGLLFSVIWLWLMDINASIVFCTEFWSSVSTWNMKRILHFRTILCFFVPNTNSTNIFSPLNQITCQHGYFNKWSNATLYLCSLQECLGFNPP